MGKTLQVLDRLRSMNFKNMIKYANEIATKENRSTIGILIDMINCTRKYQSGYIDYYEYEFYLMSEEQKKTFLTSVKNYELVKRFNNKEYFKYFNDKYEFNKKFKKYINRDFILLDNNFEDFKNFLKNKDKVVAKVADLDGGKGVEVINLENKDPQELYNNLISNNQLLIEEFVVQHPELASLYPNSVNTMRMFTFNDGKEVHHLTTALKMGNGANVDNFATGGMYTFVDDNGLVLYPAFDNKDQLYEKHPVTNKQIINFQVPLYQEAKQLLEAAARVVPEVKYIGWDVAIGVDKPIIIEGNSNPGVFQPKASLSKDKVGVIPKYEKAMKVKI